MGKERSGERRVLKNSLFPSSKLHQFVHGGVDLVHRNCYVQPECSKFWNRQRWKGNPQSSPRSSTNLKCKVEILKNISLRPSIKDFEAPFTKIDDVDFIMANQLPQIVMQYLRRAQISCNVLQQFTTIPMF